MQVLQLRSDRDVVSICSRVGAGSYALSWEPVAHMTIAYVACTADEDIQRPHTVKIRNQDPQHGIPKTHSEMCMDLTRYTVQREDRSQCAVLINPVIAFLQALPT